MRGTKRMMQAAGLAAGVLGVIAAGAPETAVGRSVRAVSRRIARDVRYAAGAMPGVVYRLSGRRPDPDVSDAVLADRIRSTIGPLEKALDVPRVHVAVEDHVAIVHGNVTDVHAAHEITHAIMAVSGVRGVESHLHAGLEAGDTRPSEGRSQARPSDALLSLLAAAEGNGATDPRRAVHAVLCGFVDRIPAGERTQLLAHLPADARVLAGPPHRHGAHRPRMRTVADLVAAATDEGGIDREAADAITRAVLTTVRSLVPEEAHDVAAALPRELRELWERDATASPR